MRGTSWCSSSTSSRTATSASTRGGGDHPGPVITHAGDVVQAATKKLLEPAPDPGGPRMSRLPRAPRDLRAGDPRRHRSDLEGPHHPPHPPDVRSQLHPRDRPRRRDVVAVEAENPVSSSLLSSRSRSAAQRGRRLRRDRPDAPDVQEKPAAPKAAERGRPVRRGTHTSRPSSASRGSAAASASSRPPPDELASHRSQRRPPLGRRHDRSGPLHPRCLGPATARSPPSPG